MKIVYDIHPAANLFPMMDDEAFAALKADIAENGLRESIVLWKNKLVDGRNRLKACEELGIQPGESELDKDQDPIAYVVSANLHRRHLTTSQRAEIAAKLATGTKGGDRKSEKIKGSNGPLKIDDAAKLLNVSPKSVKRAKERQTRKPKSAVQNSAPQKTSESPTVAEVVAKSTPPNSKPQSSRKKSRTWTADDIRRHMHSIWDNTIELFAQIDPSVPEDTDDYSEPCAKILRRMMADESWDSTVDAEICEHIDDTVKILQSLRSCFTGGAVQATTDADAIRPHFSVVKLDGAWIPAIDGAIFMGVDNAFSTKGAATKSVEYWREKCANDSQEFERISENAKRYREAASGAYPVIEGE